VVVYGPRGAGKTTATLRLAEKFGAQGLRVGGFFQRTTTDDLDRRGYDLVRVADKTAAVPLARPGVPKDQATESSVCSFVFAREAFVKGLEWLRADAAWADVLVIDEVSKLEVSGEGHFAALRWAAALEARMIVLLSVRAEQLFYVVEKFELEERISGYVELPATDAELAGLTLRLAPLP